MVTAARQRLAGESDRVVARNLRRLRRLRELTHADVATALGLARSTVSALECGRIRVRASMLPTLARLFGVSIDAVCRPDDRTPLPPREETPIERRLRELAVSYAAIEDEGVRLALTAMAQALASPCKR